MKFEDLTQHDILMIKSLAMNVLVSTKCACRYEALSEEVLGCIYAKGYKIQPYPDKLSLVIADGVKSEVGSSDEVIKAIFKFVLDQNLEIIKDETRTSMWSSPRSGWYTSYNNHKKSWQF